MPDRFVETHIRKIPLFSRLPDDQLRWVTEAFRVMRVEPGEFIFRQGQPTQGMYMLITGRADLIQTGADHTVNRHLGSVGPNQYLNEVALFKPGTESASLRVAETATVLFISRQRLRDVISHHPEIKEYIPIPVPAAQQQKREKLFRGQRDNETALLDTRRHWWAFVSKIWWTFVVFIIATIAFSFIPNGGITVSFIAVTFILCSLYALYVYLEWQNDHVIVTNQRLIRIEHVIHTLQTSISEVPLISIHEVNADNTTDLFSRILNYGTVELKTAGDAGNIKLTMIPKPEAIQNLIFDQLNRQADREDQEHRNVIRAEVDKVLGKHTGETGVVSNRTAGDAPPTVTKKRGLLSTSYMDAQGRTIYRKHITTWLRAISLPLLGLIATTIMIPLSLTALDLGIIGAIFSFFLFIIFALGFYWADWDWRHDIYIVGDHTIELIHRRPLWLQNESDQILVERIDNVISEKQGLFQSLFDYGHVRISLIGGDKGDQKVFRYVASPQHVQAEITRRQARLREEIAEYLSVYHETVKNGEQFPAETQPNNQPPKDRMRPPHIPRQRRP